MVDFLWTVILERIEVSIGLLVIAILIVLEGYIIRYKNLEFNRVWKSRVFFLSAAIFWVVSMLLGRDTFWDGNGAFHLSQQQHLVLCQIYVLFTFGISQPLFFLTLLFMIRSRLMVKKDDNKLALEKSNPNKYVVGWSLGLCIPITAVHLLLIGLNHNEKISEPRPLFWTTYDQQEEKCVIPIISTATFAFFFVIFLIFYTYFCSRFSDILINRKLRARVRWTQLFFTLFLPFEVILRVLMVVVAQVRVTGGDVLRQFFFFVDLVVCLVGVVEFAFLPIRDSLDFPLLTGFANLQYVQYLKVDPKERPKTVRASKPPLNVPNDATALESITMEIVVDEKKKRTSLLPQASGITASPSLISDDHNHPLLHYDDDIKRHHRREQSLDKSRERDREREKEKEKEKERERERERENKDNRDKEKDRNRDKEKERVRDKEKDRERDRDRERNRDRDSSKDYRDYGNSRRISKTNLFDSIEREKSTIPYKPLGLETYDHLPLRESPKNKHTHARSASTSSSAERDHKKYNESVREKHKSGGNYRSYSNAKSRELEKERDKDRDKDRERERNGSREKERNGASRDNRDRRHSARIYSEKDTYGRTAASSLQGSNSHSSLSSSQSPPLKHSSDTDNSSLQDSSTFQHLTKINSDTSTSSSHSQSPSPSPSQSNTQHSHTHSRPTRPTTRPHSIKIDNTPSSSSSTTTTTTTTTSSSSSNNNQTRPTLTSQTSSRGIDINDFRDQLMKHSTLRKGNVNVNV